MLPTLGRIVLYQTDGRGGYRYSLPAVVVRTRASTDPKAVKDGKVEELPDDMTVDLLVHSCAGESYGESGVPFSDILTVDSSRPQDPFARPRTWRWPPRI